MYRSNHQQNIRLARIFATPVKTCTSIYLGNRKLYVWKAGRKLPRLFCVQFMFLFPLCTQQFFTLSFLLLRNLQRCTLLPTKWTFCFDGPYCFHCHRLKNGAVLFDYTGLGTGSSPQIVSVTVQWRVNHCVGVGGYWTVELPDTQLVVTSLLCHPTAH
jgi:hypothetical protein